MASAELSPAVETKLWGETRCIHLSDDTQVMHASIRAGGYSSVHYHKARHNDFYVVSGTLQVHFYEMETWHRGRELPTRTRTVVLGAGDRLVIPPLCWHSFEASTDVELIETYWRPSIDPHDIVRHDEGGLRTA